MNIVEHASILNESYRVTNVPKASVLVERLKNGIVVSAKQFEIGDLAEYDSFNLRYIGKIVAIGEKTITIQEKGRDRRRHRLNTRTFAFRNWDFDLTEVTHHNHEMMLNI